ncbi:hypothetical protein FGO68_gene7492 [Halteria grandinella]|uniref:Fatty acid desaturase domain-containing protein n=1 Tax=Halteria grandinella TaxID=5974 RepID=A0A8J8T0R8_HALGN|nr:hypothetical protein FGO68_gene7492 [Halteria grandinella]
MKTETATKKNSAVGPTWWDILPYFLGTAIFAGHLILQNTLYRNCMVYVWIGYVVIPLFDYLLPKDNKNLSREEAIKWQRDPRFLVPLYAVWALDVGTYIYVMWGMTTGELGGNWKEFLAMTIYASQNGMVNIVVGHELIHHKGQIHKILGSFPYFKAMYSHFYLLHVFVHHKQVATPDDPQSARFGESVYQYFARAIPTGFKKTYDFECERLKEMGQEGSFIKNRFLITSVIQVIYMTAVYVFLGERTLGFHLLYTLIMILEFETVNYVEHYGLSRKLLSDGKTYEKVDLKHSWNAPQAITNIIFFKLQRHSDHHENAYKPYQVLESYPEKSPELPYGYSISIILSFTPYVWKKVIDPLAIAANDKTVPIDNKEHHLWVAGTLLIFSIIFTYITFVVFDPSNSF